MGPRAVRSVGCWFGPASAHRRIALLLAKTCYLSFPLGRLTSVFVSTMPGERRPSRVARHSEMHYTYIHAEPGRGDGHVLRTLYQHIICMAPLLAVYHGPRTPCPLSNSNLIVQYAGERGPVDSPISGTLPQATRVGTLVFVNPGGPKVLGPERGISSGSPAPAILQ